MGYFGSFWVIRSLSQTNVRLLSNLCRNEVMVLRLKIHARTHYGRKVAIPNQHVEGDDK